MATAQVLRARNVGGWVIDQFTSPTSSCPVAGTLGRERDRLSLYEKLTKDLATQLPWKIKEAAVLTLTRMTVTFVHTSFLYNLIQVVAIQSSISCMISLRETEQVMAEKELMQ